MSLFIFYVITHNEFSILIEGGDNKTYVGIAKSIAEGFDASSSPYAFINGIYFLGYPLFLAPFAYFLDNFNLFFLLPFLNVILGFLNILIIKNLFGKKVAFFSIFANLALTQRIFLGGAEPFFMFIGLLVIYFYTRTPSLAFIFSALSFWVRPFGSFFVFGVLSTQFFKKGISLKSLLYPLFIVLLIMGAYILISHWFYGNYSIVDGYNNVWEKHTPLGIPFRHIIQGLYNESRMLTFSKVLAYVGISLVPFFSVVKRCFIKNSLSTLTVYDWIYLSYLTFVYQLNSPWGYIEFVRYVSPVFPIALFYSEKYLPDSKVISYLILISAVSLSALSIKGSLLNLPFDKLLWY